MHSISTFARLTGITPSALRFYDDCGALAPARVDPVTGYRYYEENQMDRAVLLRKLRVAGVPLAAATTVLDGDPADARRVLDEHAGRLRTEADVQRRALDDVLRSLPGTGALEIRLGGPELAAAVRQVAPTASGESSDVLGCVLVEVTAERQVRVVATDRYRLALRELSPADVVGAPRPVLVPAPALTGLTAWLARQAAVTIDASSHGTTVVADSGERHELPSFEGEFPAYREVLRGLAAPTHRVLVDRIAFAGAVAEGGNPAVLRTGSDSVDVDGVALPALCGEGALLGFDPAVLGPALDASVGPEVLLEISAADAPVVVRSADQGEFTTLVMPVVLPA